MQRPGGQELHGELHQCGEGGRLWHGPGRLREGVLQDGGQALPPRQVDGTGVFAGKYLFSS